MGEKNNSTFLIKSSADKNRSFGTGFCVHNDDKGSFLLTAGHVVESCGRDDLLVSSYSATLLHISKDDDTLDLALIYVEGLTNSSPLKLSDEKAKEKDEFTIVGYRPHKNDHAKEPLNGSIKKAYSLESKHIRNIYELTINDGDSIEQGYSGSAVVSAVTGLVVAIATDRKRDGKQAFATPAYYLTEIWKDMPNTLFQSSSDVNPYKGLNSFGYDDQANYYGREEEAKEIAKTLKNTRLLTLLGASGSGKSSLIYAGVVPFIEEDGVEILTFRPLDNPLKSLASLFIPLLYEDKLEQLRKEKELANDLLKNSITITQLVEQLLEKKRAKHLYLVIDQFEELFTLTDDKEHRGTFLAKVLELITGTLLVTLLISMRADFLTYLSYSDSLNEVYNNYPNKMLAILKKEKLKAVIEKPASALGVTFADGLVEKIIEEIEQEAGQLPLLEFALEQLWRHKKGRVISFDTLEQIGSITQSISHYADSVYERYRDRENSIKRIFLNLVRVGSQNTKKVTKIEEFSPDDRETITLLANERLIVTDENDVEIVHEALIREWQQLKDWINEYKSFLQWKERISIDRSFYEKKKSKKENFLQEGKLFEAKLFLEKYREYIFDKDIEFIEKSVEAQRKRENRKRMILGGVFASLLVVIGVIGYFWVEADEATIKAVNAKEEANREKNKAQNLLYDNTLQQGVLYRYHLNEPLKAKYIYGKAISKSRTKTEEKNAKIVYSKLNGFMKLNKILETEHLSNLLENGIVNFSNSKNIKLLGNRIEYIFHDSEVVYYERKDKLYNILLSKFPEIKGYYHNGITGLVYNKNHTKLLSWGGEENSQVQVSSVGKVRIWDIVNNKLLLTLKHPKIIDGAMFINNEKQILSWGFDGKIRLWDIETGKLLNVVKHACRIEKVVLLKNKKQLLSWDWCENIKLWDIFDKKEKSVLMHKKNVEEVKLLNNNKLLSWSDNIINVWNLENMNLLFSLEDNKSINMVKISKNKDKILSSSSFKKGSFSLWNSKNGELLFRKNYKEPVNEAIFTNDEQQILSWTDSNIELWNLENNKSTYKLKYGTEDAIYSRKYILSWDLLEGIIKLWDIDKKKLIFNKKYGDFLTDAKFCKKDEQIIFTLEAGRFNGRVELWDIKTNKKIKSLFDEDIGYPGIGGLSKKENKILVWLNKKIELWDLDKNKTIMTLNHKHTIWGAIFIQNDTKILSWSYDGIIKLSDISSKKTILSLKHKSYINSIVLSKNEKLILSSSEDGTVKLWSTQINKPLITWKYNESVQGAKFNKDETKIISWTEHKIYIHDIQINNKLKKEFYPLEAEVESGCTLIKLGEIRVLSKEEWEEKKRRYEEALRESE